MYKFEGDGSYNSTTIWRNNIQTDYEDCEFRINVSEGCVAVVDGVEGTVDRMLINGVYMIISEGAFNNSKVFYMDEMLHGVQWITGSITKEGHPELIIGAVMLPNLVQESEEIPLREVE